MIWINLKFKHLCLNLHSKYLNKRRVKTQTSVEVPRLWHNCGWTVTEYSSIKCNAYIHTYVQKYIHIEEFNCQCDKIFEKGIKSLNNINTSQQQQGQAHEQHQHYRHHHRTRSTTTMDKSNVVYFEKGPNNFEYNTMFLTFERIWVGALS